MQDQLHREESADSGYGSNPAHIPNNNTHGRRRRDSNRRDSFESVFEQRPATLPTEGGRGMVPCSPETTPNDGRSQLVLGMETFVTPNNGKLVMTTSTPTTPTVEKQIHLNKQLSAPPKIDCRRDNNNREI